MEKQLTIFDVFAEMDMNMDVEKDGDKNVYDDFLGADYRFEKNKKMNARMRDEMIVVCNQTNKHLFQITIKYNQLGMLSFAYNAMDNYWGGSYTTGDADDARKSIRRLVDDERSDRQIKKPL